MSSSTNRWAEYNAGTLVPPVIVQHDIDDDGKHNIWVYSQLGGIVGPIPRKNFNEAEVLACGNEAGQPQYQITCEDGTVIQA